MPDSHFTPDKWTTRLIRTIVFLFMLQAAGVLSAADIPVSSDLTSDSTTVAQSESTLEYHPVVALDPQQGLAVVKTDSGNLEVIAAGDPYPGSDLVVTHVLADKLVAEEVIDGGNRVPRQIWIYKVKDTESSSRVERLLLKPPRQDALTSVDTGQSVILNAPAAQDDSQ